MKIILKKGRIVVPKINSVNFLLWIFTLFFFIMEVLRDVGLVGQTGNTKYVEYFFVIIIITFFSLVKIFYQKSKHHGQFFGIEIRQFIVFSIIIFLLSLSKSYYVHEFNIISLIEVLQILIPIILTYFLVNILTENQLISLVKICLLVTCMGYAYLISQMNISISDLSKISLVNSYSPFESWNLAEIASGISCFLIFYHKRAPISCFISVLINIMMFKRVLIFMDIVLIIVVILKKELSLCKEKTTNFFILFWIIIVEFIYQIYQKENQYKLLSHGINLVKFTMARIYRLWFLTENHFVSYGLGSTGVYLTKLNYSWLGNDLEMDFIRIRFELGIIAIILLVFIYLKICKNNFYSLAMINICFLNLLMANGITQYSGWMFRILIIAIINYKYINQGALK
ncbi:MAG: hypothetical protein PUE89_06725 [Lachnospiraceae bacterium]|nr:hypothetical protein [Lachnospiraceae bacterium]